MDIGFIGLGKMGFPMARRLIEAGHRLVVFDQRQQAVDSLVALGAQAASSPGQVADRAETVMASLPSLSPPSARIWRCGSMICWRNVTSCSSTVR
jgi:3-hydroxyisobutyrate dehydrogenase-like beta-hydroxyacid dehydrogenase